MGFKYNIYKYFKDKKKIKSISDKAMKNLILTLDRFKIGEVCFLGNSRKLLDIKKRFDWNKVTSGLKGSGRITVTEDKLPEEKGSFVFTPDEFLALLETPDYIAETEIPRVLNTVENGFDRFVLFGESSYADILFRYFSENPGIDIKRLDPACIDRSGEDWVITDPAITKDVFVIVADFYNYHHIICSSGAQMRTFFVRRTYCPFKKTTEYLLDLREYIVPTLRANNVKVIQAYIPVIDRLKKSDKVMKTTVKWGRLKRYTPWLFEKLRNKKENSEEIRKDAARIINDNTKGYSINYCNGKYINYDNGFRRTVGNSPDVKNSIHVFGPCFVRGNNFADDGTITSLLKKAVGDRYNVYNYGSTFHTLNYIMREREYEEGDIAVIFCPMDAGSKEKAECDAEIDLTDVFDSIDDIYNHVFDLAEHFDSTVAKRITEVLYDIIEEKFAGNKPDSPLPLVTKFGAYPKRIPVLDSLPDKAFATWLKSLSPYVKRGKRNGAIVMNCNPFTNGHRYLIETAAEQVDNLYIFVVEEDKSEFKFADRIKLVKEGCADLLNVIVLPSGNYVISAQTLPGYFNKDNLGTTELNAESDLEYFMSIARFFDIKVRFAGQEPIDRFTAQYNRNMNRILPKYGIEFCEIERKKSQDQVISASKVRKAMHEGDLELVKKFVPATTYRYIQKMIEKGQLEEK